MRNLIYTLLVGFLFSSCATSVKFPVSEVTPAATISVKHKKDDNGNNVLSVVANNLSSPGRLTPPKNVFVVWAVTENNGTKNLGQLKNKNATRSTLESRTAFDPVEVFITAEKEGSITYPSGIEITRVNLEKQTKGGDSN